MAGFKTGTQNSNQYQQSDALFITPNSYLHQEGDMFGVNILGATLLRNKRSIQFITEFFALTLTLIRYFNDNPAVTSIQTKSRGYCVTRYINRPISTYPVKQSPMLFDPIRSNSHFKLKMRFNDLSKLCFEQNMSFRIKIRMYWKIKKRCSCHSAQQNDDIYEKLRYW